MPELIARQSGSWPPVACARPLRTWLGYPAGGPRLCNPSLDGTFETLQCVLHAQLGVCQFSRTAVLLSHGVSWASNVLDIEQASFMGNPNRPVARHLALAESFVDLHLAAGALSAMDAAIPWKSRRPRRRRVDLRVDMASHSKYSMSLNHHLLASQ